MTDWTYRAGPERDSDAQTGTRTARPSGGAGERRSAPTGRGFDGVRELGSVVADRYVLKGHLGRGRYGEVYEAIDRALSDPDIQQEHCVALHLLHDRVSQQTRLLQKLESAYHQPHTWSHPNVVKVRGFGCDRGQYFLVMELLDGVSLRSILDQSLAEPLSEDETFAVLRGVGDALKYAHAKGAIHGDIRPEKIFITNDYAIKVLDLLPMSSARTLPFFVEDAESNEPHSADQRDDVYGLACVAYELLAGRHPYNANSPLEALNAGLRVEPIARLDAQRWEMLARGLELRREHRTASVAAFLAELGITGRETLRPASQKAASAPAVPSAPIQPARAQHDDVPIVTNYSVAADTVEQPPAPPPPPLTRHVTTAAREASWQGEFDVHAIASRREHREPRRTVLRAVLVAALIAAIGVAAYWNRERLRGGAQAWIAMARTFAEDVRRGRSEVLFEGEPQATVAEPPVATATPDLRSDVADAAATTATDAASVADGAATPDSPVAGLQIEPSSLLAEQPPSPLTPPAPAAEPEAFEFAASVVTVAEDQAVATVVIHRRGGSLGKSSVVWWTSDGSATADDDYANFGARIEDFAPGEQARTIHIPIVVDSKAEDRESFYVNLRANDQSGRGLEPAQRIEVVIIDDD